MFGGLISLVQMMVLEEGLAVLQRVNAWTLLSLQSKEPVDFDFGPVGHISQNYRLVFIYL